MHAFIQVGTVNYVIAVPLISLDFNVVVLSSKNKKAKKKSRLSFLQAIYFIFKH